MGFPLGLHRLKKCVFQPGQRRVTLSLALISWIKDVKLPEYLEIHIISIFIVPELRGIYKGWARNPTYQIITKVQSNEITQTTERKSKQK